MRGGAGLKFFAISGDIANPDVYCVPMGTTARELIAHAGGLPDGVKLGGPSQAARRRTSSVQTSSTCRSTSSRSQTPDRCSARARWS